MVSERPGQLVVVSGPSGVGKSTVLQRLLESTSNELIPSVSATTRPPRPGEIDGAHYHFLTPEAFEQQRREGGFLECFQVFGTETWYGTPRSEVEPRLAAGQSVLLEIDVQGARQVVKEYPDAITIFIRTGTAEELESRLRGRNTETEEHIQQRLARAREEMAAADEYDHQVVNDDVDRAVREIQDILSLSEKARNV
jgi:guanylate kinase